MIQSMVVPAIMISCCGLLFLGLQNRYGRIIDRLRQFNREKENLTAADREVIRLQIKQLSFRGKLLRNALSCLLFAIVFFVLTSLFIVVKFEFTLFLFFIGMLSVLLSVIFAWLEIIISYKTVMTETRNYLQGGGQNG